MLLAFGDYRLDLGRRELRRAGELVAIEPRAFDVLAFLVAHRDRVVTKDNLLEGVWGGRIVSESALTTRINAVRRALGDDGTAQRLVRTFTRKGVRFVGEVVELPEPPTLAADKPSIAVLAFANLSGDPEQEYFVDGMVEEIIVALSRIRWLVVLARNSSFSYKGRAVDVKQVGRELGVRYVLEGSVRKNGNRLRIGGKLIDAATGALLWADRFDGSLEDVFDLQDKVASSVAGVIEPALQAAETARPAGRSATDLTAYDLYLRAAAMPRAYREALHLLEQAIGRDPRYGPALGLAAILSFRMLNDGLSEDRKRDQARCADFARRALETASDDPRTVVDAAHSLAGLGEDIGVMMALVDRALTINPNFARGWHVSGVLRNWVGQPDNAIDHLRTALRLSPRARVGSTLHQIGLAHFFARRFDRAEPKLLLAIQDDPRQPMTYRVLAACFAHTGRLEEARAMISRLRSFTPELMPPWMTLPKKRTFRNPEHIELFASGLRLAAGES